MNSWCESCARKSQCYTADIRPKCFVPITSNDRKIDPQTMYYPQIDGITPSVIVQCYLRESCDHYGDKQVCGRCREYNLYSHTKTEPQTAEKPQGEWIVHFDDLFPEESTEECSVCHAEQRINGNDDNYCSNCGARLRRMSCISCRANDY